MEINFRHEINGVKVITAIAQDAETKEILMLANMNKEALIKTIETGKAHYWSTSRNKLWLKGESSGHFQEVKECGGKDKIYDGVRKCHAVYHLRIRRSKDCFPQIIDESQIYQISEYCNKCSQPILQLRHDAASGESHIFS